MPLDVDASEGRRVHVPLRHDPGLLHGSVVTRKVTRNNRTRHRCSGTRFVFRAGVVVVGGLDASEDRPVDLDLVVRVGLLGGVLVAAPALAVNRSLKLFELVSVNNLVRDKKRIIK